MSETDEIRSARHLTSSPADAGEDRGGGLNGLNDLNGWNPCLSYAPTSSFSFSRARKIKSRLNSFSFWGGRSGLPVGLTMPPDAMARIDPTSFATGIIVHIWATGIASFSISLLIAAPQRVLEPQVDVKITPVTPAAFNFSAIPCPIRVAFSTAACAPPVACTNS